MKISECEQGGAAWFDARLGIPTASRFADFITPTGAARRGEAPRKYALALVGERLTRQPAETYVSAAMQRGTDLEPRARAWYEFSTGRTVRQIGFARHDVIACGCSPDGLCDDDRLGVEIKCPLTPGFLETASSMILPEAHLLQVQACLWITGALAWDYVLWTDTSGLAPQVIRVAPDRELFAAFEMIVPEFCAGLDAMEKVMRERGHGVIAAAAEEPLPSWDEITGKGNVI